MAGITNKIIIAGLNLLLLFAATPSWAQTIMENLNKTKVLKIGVSKDAIPFSYYQGNQWQGYSLDLINLIKQKLEAQINDKIQLQYVELSVAEWIPSIVREDVDIICDSASFTWPRARFVDFSISYFITGTQLLVKKESKLNTPTSLDGKKIGVIPDTTNQLVILENYHQSILVAVENSAQGLAALQKGEIDAFAWDGMLLEGVKTTLANPNAFEIIPQKPYQPNGYVCLIPENNSDFLDLVNLTLVEFMQGVLDKENPSQEIFDKWFSSKGLIPLKSDLLTKHFQDIVNTYGRVTLK